MTFKTAKRRKKLLTTYMTITTKCFSALKTYYYVVTLDSAF